MFSASVIIQYHKIGYIGQYIKGSQMIKWTLIYPDARYPDTSVSGRFFWGTDFFNVIFSFIQNSAFRIRMVCFYHKMHFYVITWFTYADGRFWWQVSVHIPELGINCCKNTGLAYCFYKTTRDNMWPIVLNSLSVTRIDWPIIWIRNTYLIKVNALYWITIKNLWNIL